MVYNTSMAGLQTTSSFSPLALTIVIMVAIIITVIIVSIRFRLFLMGAAVTGATYGIYCLARSIANNKISGDGALFNNWVWATGFVVVSIFVGAALYTIPAVNKFIKGLDNEGKK
jgi:hypothetical protein